MKVIGSSVLQENCLNSEVVEQIYKRNPILRHSHHPLHSPLLPLPYGDIHLSGESTPSSQCLCRSVIIIIIINEEESQTCFQGQVRLN